MTYWKLIIKCPNLERLMEKVTEIIIGKQEGEVLFTSLDKPYAYEQTILHPETAKHCNFQIIGSETTGTYNSFRTRYYGLTLTTMPLKFQKIMDRKLHKRKNTSSFKSRKGMVGLTSIVRTHKTSGRESTCSYRKTTAKVPKQSKIFSGSD